MQITIHGWDGRRPDRSESQTLSGETALDIVRGMMAVPFASRLTPLEFMAQTLRRVSSSGREVLPADESLAAVAYLFRLEELGIAERI